MRPAQAAQNRARDSCRSPLSRKTTPVSGHTSVRGSKIGSRPGTCPARACSAVGYISRVGLRRSTTTCGSRNPDLPPCSSPPVYRIARSADIALCEQPAITTGRPPKSARHRASAGRAEALITRPDGHTPACHGARSGCGRSSRPVASTTCRHRTSPPSAVRNRTPARSSSTCTEVMRHPRCHRTPHSCTRAAPTSSRAAATARNGTGLSAAATAATGETPRSRVKGPSNRTSFRNRDPTEVLRTA